MTILSTTSPRDLSEFNTNLICFSRDLPAIPETGLLQYKHKWFLGSQYGCSCGFRHLLHYDLGFSEPLDWMPEDQDDIEATRQVLTAFKQLLNEGDKVECIDAWAEDEDRPPTLLGEMAVNLAEFPGDHFRFFSGYRFELKNET